MYPAPTESEFDVAKLLRQMLPNRTGVYVDVGAGVPTGQYANYELFRNLGWKVICVEPVPTFCNRHRIHGFEVLQYAATNRDIGKTPFDVANAGTDEQAGSALSTLASEGAMASYTPEQREELIRRPPGAPGRIEVIEVEALTLNTILQRHHPEVDHIDVLDIDVEGWEIQVMEGLDFQKYNPDFLVIENLAHQQKYYDYYKKIGYQIVTHASYNEILTRIP